MSSLVPTANKSLQLQDAGKAVYTNLGALLGSTHNMEQLLDTFFFETQTWLYSDGMKFQYRARSEDHNVGIECTHNCHYKLYARHNYLGELTLSRRSKFDEEELEIIEDLLSVLLPPLARYLDTSYKSS